MGSVTLAHAIAGFERTSLLRARSSDLMSAAYELVRQAHDVAHAARNERFHARLLRSTPRFQLKPPPDRREIGR